MQLNARSFRTFRPAITQSTVHRSNRGHWLILFLLVAMGLLLAASARAATLSWSGTSPTSANWSDSANWGFAGVPADGDTLIFAASQPRQVNTNNIGPLTLNQIRFVGAGGGYSIFSSALTVTNGIQATNTVGVNSIRNNIALVNSSVVNVGSAGVSLSLFGIISGSVGLTKNGAGTLTLAGPFSNTYLGMTTVNGGVVELQKAGVPAATAIPGDMTINAGATVRNLDQLEIVDTCDVIINGGTWDLNNNNETVGDSLTIGSGGSITTGAGTCSLSPNPTITIPTGFASISGRIDISSGTCTIQNSGNLDLTAIVSGTANIIKNGNGSLHLGGANTFTGTFTANDANYVWISDAQAFGTSAGGTTMNGDTWLAFSGNYTVTNEALVLNSAYLFGGLYVFATSTTTWNGAVTFGTNVTIQILTNCSLTLGGALGGPGGFTKFGPGSLTLAGPNNTSTYLGDTTVQEGTLFLNSENVIRHGTLTIGDGWGGVNSDVVKFLKGYPIYGGAGGSTVVIRSTGILDMNNFDDDIGPFLLDGGNIATGTGNLDLFQPLGTYISDFTNNTSEISGRLRLMADSTLSITNPLVIYATIGSFSSDTLTKRGEADLYLSGSNSYTGPTLVQQGILWLQNHWALGATNSGTVVSNGASLVVSGSIGITNESLTLNGNGIASNWGSLDAENPGTNVWSGPVTVNNVCTILPYSTASNLRIVGSISGPGGIRMPSASSGTLFLEGAAPNTFAGTTFIDGGTNVLNKPASNITIPGNLVIQSAVRLGNSQQITDTADVLINAFGLLDCGNRWDRIDTLRGAGQVTFASSGWIEVGANNGSSTFDGIISGIGFPGGYTVGKFGSGTFTMNGNNTYLNITWTFEGTTVVNGSQPQSPARVDPGATLAGRGTVGNIFCEGHLRPGTSPGILTCSNLVFTSAATYHVDLNGAVAGTNYDQLNVRGTNNLASAALALDFNLTSPVAVGDPLTIINNDLSELIGGTFAGWPPGTTYSPSGYELQLSYTGGPGGNDAVFTVNQVPGAALSAAVSAGNGNAFVDIDECNHLNIVISNMTGSAMTGVSATLSTTTLGVQITQPYSFYPAVPGTGKATNSTAFQISTLPEFSCASDIDLQLSLVTASHGAFTVPLTIRSGTPAVVPTRFDVSTITNIPDVGSIESTNVVTGIFTPLTRIEVSLWLTHPFGSDLSISLIAPNGTSVDLTSGNGSGANFGSGCSPDANRTTFSDLAGTPITAGASPFIGTFRPEVGLSNLLASAPNGNWRLRITDGFGGTVGALRCWSLFLYGYTCDPGGGACGPCLTPISGTITTNDPVQVGRLTRNGIPGSCGDTKDCPGLNDSFVRHYDSYGFTNLTATNACVSVMLTSACDNNAFAVAYLGVYDPTNLCANYLSDGGQSSSGQAFSFTVPAGATYTIVVNEVTPNAGCGSYTIYLSGLPCPPPPLNIQTVATATERIYWTNSAGGYVLQGTPSLSTPAWAAVSTSPTNSGGFYNVTNPATGNATFYRLFKP